MLITGGMMQKILTEQMMMIFLLIRTLTGTHKHIIYLDMKYGNRVLNKGQTRSPSFIRVILLFKKLVMVLMVIMKLLMRIWYHISILG